MSEVETVAAEVAPAPVTVVEPTKPTIEETMAQVYDKNNPDVRVDRAKDTGQFKSKEAQAAPAEGAEESDTAEEISDQTPAVEAKETETPSIPRPQSWSADLDKLWSELPPESKEFLAKRESESHKQITTLGQLAKNAEKYEGIVEKYRQVIGNSPPEKEIESLLSTKAALLRDPVNSIRWLAQQLNVDLSQVYPAAQIGSGEHPESAMFNALHQEIAQLKQQLFGVTSQITAQQQAEMQAKEQTLVQSIDKFAEEPSRKDHWSDVEDEVLRQVHALKIDDPQRAQADPLSVLKEAYERAVQLKPEVRAKLEKSAKVEADKKAQTEAKKKADDAKKAASLNVRSSSGTNPKPSSKSMYDDMTEIYERMNAG